MVNTVIFGEADDYHVVAIASHLDNPIVLDEATIQNDITLTTGLFDTPAIRLDGELLKPTSVLWRNLDLDPFDTPHFPNDIAYFKLFLEAFKEADMVNPLSSFIDHYTKIDQLRKAQVLFPPSLITNCWEDAATFAEQFEDVAVKPVSGGEYVKRFSAIEEFIEPMMLQEFIKGDNIRSFVIGERVYSAIAQSTLDDFRLDDEMTYQPIELTAEQTATAVGIAKTLGYKYTAIDWIKRGDDLYFLEANFSPMFLFFEKQTGYPITDLLLKLLIQ